MSRAPIFVLVHGAWQTAATWDLTVPILRRAGRQIFTPSLTGLEGNAGELTDRVTLDTHIENVVRLLESEQLQGATLVGHSYAGMVITGAAERAPGRVAHLVYVDAFVPGHGQSVMQLIHETIQTMFREQAKANGDGWRLPASDRQLDLWGLKEGASRQFVKDRQSDFSIKCFEQPIQLPRNVAVKLPRTYIACVAEDYPARAVFSPFAARAKADGWSSYELRTGHDCHVEMPEAFCKLLLSA